MKTQNQSLTVGCILLFVLNVVNVSGDDMILRYSPDDPEIRPMLESRSAVPPLNADEIKRRAFRISESDSLERAIPMAKTLVDIGAWKGVPHDCYTKFPPMEGNPEVNWRSIQFTTGRVVRIQYEMLRNGEIRDFAGTYKVVFRPLKSGSSRGAFNIVVNSQNPEEKKIAVLLDVRIQEANMIVAFGLWFNCPRGYVYAFDPAREITHEELRKRLGITVVPMSEVEEARRKAIEEQRRGKIRETDLVLTKQVIEKLQNGKLSHHERNDLILDLLNKGDETCVPTLIEHTADKYDGLVRQTAIRALAKVGGKQAVSAIADILKKPIKGKIEDEENEDEFMIRRSAVRALIALGDPSSLPVLKAMTQSEKEYPSIRERAAYAIRRLEKKDTWQDRGQPPK